MMFRAPMTPLQIYIHRTGQQTGPYSLDEIQSHLRSGALEGSDWAWHEGASGWIPLSSVPGATSLRLVPRVPVNTKPKNRGWLAVGAITSALFSTIILVATVMRFTDSSARKHGILAP